METSDSLLTDLLLKHPDATEDEYQEFFRQLITHHFAGQLNLYDKNTSPLPEVVPYPTIPAEREISFLMGQEHPELFFRNILYHLRRNKKVFPAAMLPGLLTMFKDQPELWEPTYHQHPELIIHLARENGDWNYMLRVFEPDITLEVGSPGYYTALRSRMRMFPLRTSSYIMDLFPDISPYQKGQLLQILHEDPSPESRKFVRDQVGHGRKPVRLAALRSTLIRKDEDVYFPVRDELIHWIKTSKEIKSEELPASWKDLAEITGEDKKENILIALTDPEDYQSLQTPTFQSGHRSTLRKAAIFHRSQQKLYALATATPFLHLDTELTGVMDSKTAGKTLLYLSKNESLSLDKVYFDLLKNIHPFLSESGSDLVWKRFAKQWQDIAFTLEELPLEVLALRIHPNRIKSIWQHPLLQDNTPAIHKIRDTLKNRLAFLKKCYG